MTYPIFPCNADTKGPLVPGGFHAATDNAVQLAAWQDEFPGCLWGVPTGEITGFCALDIDLGRPGAKGESAKAWLSANKLPRTRTVRTRSGGLHVMFQPVPGLKCSADKIALGVDIRATGGYVVDWTRDGAGGKLLIDAPIVEMPDWLRLAIAKDQADEGDAPKDTTPPPSIDAVVELLDALPNPTTTTRDDWVKLCGAACFCAEQLDDHEDKIKDAWCRWSDRWEGGAEEGSANKWDYETGKPHRAGWATLLYHGRRAGIGVSRGDADVEFDDVLRAAPLGGTPEAAQAVAQTRQKALELDRNDPMEAAREIVRALYTIDGKRTLRHWRGGFYIWTGTHYRAAGVDEIDKAMWRVLADAVTIKIIKGKDGEEDDYQLVPFAPKRTNVADVVAALSALTDLPDHVEAPTWLGRAGMPPEEILPCGNGLLHIPTRALSPHTPEFFGVNALPYAYDAAAPEPTEWIRFLRSVWPDDQESIDTLQELFGLLLTQDTRYQKIWLIVGPARSGKGTINRVLTEMLGKANTCSPTLGQLGQQFGMASIIGKPLAVISDANLGYRADAAAITECLKAVSGEDQRTVQRKHMADWTGTLPTRFVIMANELPRLGDTSSALSSRLIVLQMTTSFLGREDQGLTDRLLAELPGILLWSLDGLARLNRRRYFIQPASGRDAISDMADMSSPISVFMRERCALGPAKFIDCAELFTAWRVWCGDQHRDAVGTAQTFGVMLRSAMPSVKTKAFKDKGKIVRRYVGIGTAPEAESDDLEALLR